MNPSVPQQHADKYPNIPPRIDAIEHVAAKRNHFFGAPSVNGARSTSGGTGKKLDSAKLSKNRARSPCGVSAKWITQSYNLR